MYPLEQIVNLLLNLQNGLNNNPILNSDGKNGLGQQSDPLSPYFADLGKRGDGTYTRQLAGDASSDAITTNLLGRWLDLNNASFTDNARRDAALNSYMDWLKTLNTRDYDRALQLDERNYTAPSALLGRLMQTGLSRQAALQLLGSMSGGSGAGSAGAAPVSSQLASSPGASENFANYVGGATSIVNAIASLASVGINASTANATNSLTSAQALAQQNLNTAQQLSGKFNGAIYEANKIGFLNPQDLSFDDAYKKLGSISKDISPSLYDYVNSDDYKNVMSLPASYDISGANYNTRFRNSSVLQQALQEQVRSETMKIDLAKLTTDYDWQQLQFEDYKIPRDLISQHNLYDWYIKTSVLRELQDPKHIDNMVKELKNDKAYMAVTSAMRLRVQDSLSKMVSDNPEATDALKLCYFFDMCGLSGEVGSFIKGASVGSSAFNWFNRNQEDTTAGKLWNRFKSHLQDLDTQREESFSIPESIKSLGTDMESNIESGYDPDFWKKLLK